MSLTSEPDKCGLFAKNWQHWDAHLGRPRAVVCRRGRCTGAPGASLAQRSSSASALAPTGRGPPTHGSGDVGRRRVGGPRWLCSATLRPPRPGKTELRRTGAARVARRWDQAHKGGRNGVIRKCRELQGAGGLDHFGLGRGDAMRAVLLTATSLHSSIAVTPLP